MYKITQYMLLVANKMHVLSCSTTPLHTKSQPVTSVSSCVSIQPSVTNDDSPNNTHIFLEKVSLSEESEEGEKVSDQGFSKIIEKHYTICFNKPSL